MLGEIPISLKQSMQSEVANPAANNESSLFEDRDKELDSEIYQVPKPKGI